MARRGARRAPLGDPQRVRPRPHLLGRTPSRRSRAGLVNLGVKCGSQPISFRAVGHASEEQVRKGEEEKARLRDKARQEMIVIDEEERKRRGEHFLGVRFIIILRLSLCFLRTRTSLVHSIL